MITFDSLRNDLKALGVSSGDLLFLRISYKAIGRVEGGPKTFVDALLDVVGKEGTIVAYHLFLLDIVPLQDYFINIVFLK